MPGFDYSVLALINIYFSGRKQQTKIGTNFSNWADIILGAAQGSTFGPLVFNIYINWIFFFSEETKVTNYAEDNTPFACDTTVYIVIDRFEKHIGNLLQWFKLNYFKPNLDKCHLLLNNSSSNLCIKVRGNTISNLRMKNFLGLQLILPSISILMLATYAKKLIKNSKFLQGCQIIWSKKSSCKVVTFYGARQAQVSYEGFYHILI